MRLMEFEGEAVAFGISKISAFDDGSCTEYSSVEFNEESGRRILIENVNFMNEVGRLFELNEPCRIHLMTGKKNVKIAFGIKRADGQAAYQSLQKVEIHTGLMLIGLGIPLTLFLIGIPAILYGLYFLFRAPFNEEARRRAFYGQDPIIARQLAAREIVRV
ncbi:hypothetical protein [Bosea sp. TAB14]|uniref:hypothetical protein n=1 Tax=Bosea sp. TAB14 TaxID=3237481 RepID=UPI003F9099E9